MLSMGDMFNGNDFFCNDLSWAFPILVSNESDGKSVDTASDQKEKGNNGNDGKMVGDAGNQSRQQVESRKGKETEAEEAGTELSPPPEVRGKKRAAGGELEHDQHIITERERRRKMRNMFNDLHSLIPHLPPRADKSTIVDEAVEYIRSLQQTVRKLEKQRLKAGGGGGGGGAAKATGRDLSSLTAKQKPPPIQSREAFLADQSAGSKSPAITLANPNNEFPGAAAVVFKTWTSPNLVLNVAGKDAHVSICCPNNKPGVLRTVCVVMDYYQLEVVSVQISANAWGRMYLIHAHAKGAADQFPEALLFVEEVYKQAATEIMAWLTS